MKDPKICFYCEKVFTDYLESGGEYALRHFCVCRRCSELQSERQDSSYTTIRPFNGYGQVLDLIKGFRSLAFILDFPIDEFPDRPWSFQLFLDLIQDLSYDHFSKPYPDDPFFEENPKVTKAREAFYQALDRVRKYDSGEYEQISIPLPPPGARIKDRDPS